MRDEIISSIQKVDTYTRQHDELFFNLLEDSIHDYIHYTMTISSRSLSNSDSIDCSMQSLTVEDHIDNFLIKKFRKSRSFPTKRSYKTVLQMYLEFLKNQQLDYFFL